MQLSLFDDNRLQILLNCVDDCLRCLDFDHADTILEQIREGYPKEPELPLMQQLVDEWRVRLFDPSTDWNNPVHLQQVRCAALQVTKKKLREAVLAAVCNAVLALPHPYRIYLPPDFHIGPLLTELHRYQEAADLLQAAMGESSVPPGKLMTWFANALTLLKQGDDALQWYLSACLLDPENVSFEMITHQQFRNLWIDWLAEREEEDQTCDAAWLPVWGVLQRLFELPLQYLQAALLDQGSLHNAASNNELPLPRRWFYLLLKAEEQRKQNGDYSATRRTMKQLNPFLFQKYMILMVNQR